MLHSTVVFLNLLYFFYFYSSNYRIGMTTFLTLLYFLLKQTPKILYLLLS